MTLHPPTAAVRESFGQAQQQAAALADAPAPWNAVPVAASAVSARWLVAAAAAVVAGGMAGWLGAEGWRGPGPARSTVPTGQQAGTPSPATPVPAASPAHDGRVPPAPAPSLAPTALGALDVNRQSGVIRIAASNAPLTDAVRALALATHTSVKGGEALASIASPVTLHWQGSDPAAAWDALLGRVASIAVSCGKAACELWIVGGIAPPRAAGGPLATGSPATIAPRPMPPPEASPASGDENTETN